MWQFHNLSIFNKIIIIIVFVLSGYALTQSLSVYYQIGEDFLIQKNRVLVDKKTEITEKMNMVYKLAMQLYQRQSKIENIKATYRDKLKSLIETINSSLEYQYNSMKNQGIADDIIQEKLKDYLRHVRYENDSGYIFTYNLQGIIISHADKSLENQYFLDVQDATGKYFAREFMAIAKSPVGEGLTHYYWKKLGHEKPLLKVSYVKLFKPYQWIIGTGIYVEDWLPALKLEIAQLITSYFYDLGSTKNNYFFILDEKGTTVLNGGFPELNGKSIWDFQDVEGHFFTQEMIKTARDSAAKTGFVDYLWPHPITHEKIDKLTYVQWFEPFRWIIATGIYLSDLGIEDIERRLKQKTYNIIRRIVLSGSLFLLIGIFMSIGLVKIITKPLILARNAAEEIAKGHFSQEVHYHAKDEIGQLVTTLNFMSKQLKLSFDRLNDKNEELMALNQEKNEILGIAAHDLKNPLSGILGLSEHLLNERDDISTEEFASYMEMIRESSKQMFLLIGNLLDVNKLESGRLNVDLSPADLLPILQLVIHNYQMQAQAKQLVLQLIADETAYVAFVDKGLAYQILDNLISNAIKYSPFGKNIYARLFISSEKTICCAVQDEGVGLSMQDQEKLFSKFQRLSTKPTGGEHSTGLGLFIVKKLVEVQNGQVWCESEIGKGATFIVEFPANCGNALM